MVTYGIHNLLLLLGECNVDSGLGTGRSFTRHYPVDSDSYGWFLCWTYCEFILCIDLTIQVIIPGRRAAAVEEAEAVKKRRASVLFIHRL